MPLDHVPHIHDEFYRDTHPELQNAYSRVSASKNEELFGAFKSTVLLLLEKGTKNQQNDIGIAAANMVESGDTALFDRIKARKYDQPEYTTDLKASLQTLKNAIHSHCLLKGIEVHSSIGDALDLASLKNINKGLEN